MKKDPDSSPSLRSRVRMTVEGIGMIWSWFVILSGTKDLNQRKRALRFFTEPVLSLTKRFFPFTTLKGQNDKSGMGQGKR